MTRLDLNIFKELFEKFIVLDPIKDFPWEFQRKIIIDSVFIIALSKSGIISNPDQLPINNHHLLELIQNFINKNFPEIPSFLLEGFFFDASLNFKKNNSRFLQLDKSLKKNEGIFFTPLETSSQFISDFQFHYSRSIKYNIRQPKILDLASGYGVFSILFTLKAGEPGNPFYSNLELPHIEKLFNKSVSPSTRSKLNHIFLNLTCLEKNPIGVELSRRSLLLTALIKENNIITYENFIYLTKLLTNIKHCDIYDLYNSSGNNSFFPEFDLIVSNPPYLSYYSRQSKDNIFSDQTFLNMKNKLAFKTSQNSKGRVNSVMFFVDYALKKLNPGGYACFLIDMNIHENLFLNMRKWLHEISTLLQTTVNIHDFPGVNSGQTFIYLKKSPSPPDFQTILKDPEKNIFQEIPLNKLKAIDSFYIKTQSIWQNQLKGYPSLNRLAQINTGINIGGSSQEFLSSDFKGNNFYPIISVSQLKQKYFLGNLNNPFYIDFNQEKAEAINKKNQSSIKKNIVVLGRLERFLGPKLFIRQSSLEIIAAFTDKDLISPYSIFVLNARPHASIFSILGILNSQLITNYARESGIIRYGAGKQPQIRKKGLDNIPIPPEENFITYSERLENLVKNLLYNIPQTNSIDLNNQKIEIEKTVALMYNLDVSDYT